MAIVHQDIVRDEKDRTLYYYNFTEQSQIYSEIIINLTHEFTNPNLSAHKNIYYLLQVALAYYHNVKFHRAL